MMRTLIKALLPAFAAVLLAAFGALALEGQGPGHKKGDGQPPRSMDFAPGQGEARPTLIIRGKGGKITDVERQGVQPLRPGEPDAGPGTAPGHDSEE